jgi:hypothetical protein
MGTRTFDRIYIDEDWLTFAEIAETPGEWEVKTASGRMLVKMGAPKSDVLIPMTRFLEHFGLTGALNISPAGLRVFPIFGFSCPNKENDAEWFKTDTLTTYEGAAFVYADRAGTARGFVQEYVDGTTAIVSINFNLKQGWNTVITSGMVIGNTSIFTMVTGKPDNNFVWTVGEP